MDTPFQYQGGELQAGGVPLARLAAEHGTPLYVYHRPTIEARLDAVRRAFREHPTQICYSVKANSNLRLLKWLAGLGVGFDVVSAGEIARTAACGVDADRVVFAGVGKTQAELEAGVEAGLWMINVESVDEARTLAEIAALRGLQKVAPIFAAVFTLVMMSSIGLPGLNGFVGEFLVLVGSFLTRRWWAVVAAGGVILAALYLLWAYQRVFHGEVDEDNKGFAEMSWREGAVLAPLLALIVFLGIYPKPMLERIEPAVVALIEHVEDKAGFDAAEPTVLTPAEHETDTTTDTSDTTGDTATHGEEGE